MHIIAGPCPGLSPLVLRKCVSPLPRCPPCLPAGSCLSPPIGCGTEQCTQLCGHLCTLEGRGGEGGRGCRKGKQEERRGRRRRRGKGRRGERRGRRRRERDLQSQYVSVVCHAQATQYAKAQWCVVSLPHATWLLIPFLYSASHYKDPLHHIDSISRNKHHPPPPPPLPAALLNGLMRKTCYLLPADGLTLLQLSGRSRTLQEAAAVPG